MTLCVASSETGMALTDVLLSEWRVKISQKHPPFPPFCKEFAKECKKEMVTKCYMSAHCNHSLRFCVFAFVF